MKKFGKHNKTNQEKPRVAEANPAKSPCCGSNPCSQPAPCKSEWPVKDSLRRHKDRS